MDHKQSGWVNLLYEIERSRRRIRIVCISIKDKTMQRLLWSDFPPNFLRMICSLWSSPIYPREMVVICEFCGFSSLLEPTTMPLDCTMGTVSRYSTATTGRSNFHTVVCQSVCRSPLYLRPRYRARHRLRCITGTETVSLPSHATVRLEKYYNEQLSKSGGVGRYFTWPVIWHAQHSRRSYCKTNSGFNVFTVYYKIHATVFGTTNSLSTEGGE